MPPASVLADETNDAPRSGATASTGTGTLGGRSRGDEALCGATRHRTSCFLPQNVLGDDVREAAALRVVDSVGAQAG